MDRVSVLGIPFHAISLDQAVKEAKKMIRSCRFHLVVTPNPEIVMKAKKDKKYEALLQKADLVLPDGIGIVIGTKFKKNKVKTRVPGFDFVTALMKNREQDFIFYFLGAKEGIADKAMKQAQKQYPGILIAGTHHGYFKEDGDDGVIDKILESGANIVLSAMGAPRQEFFLQKLGKKGFTGLGIGVGGTLDVLSGEVERAPVFYQKTGLEWLYRMVKDPIRFKRAGALPVFLIKAWTEK